MEKIILAAGCFWGVEEYYKRLKGIIKTNVGYIDGEKDNPTYEDVCNSSGHVEAVEIYFETTQINLDKVLEHFFRIIDPTSVNKQGEDEGIQYRTGIYFNKPEQELIIKEYINEKQKYYDQKIVIDVKNESKFYNAEDYHQNYLEKNPNGYCHINMHLIRDEEKK